MKWLLKLLISLLKCHLSGEVFSNYSSSNTPCLVTIYFHTLLYFNSQYLWIIEIFFKFYFIFKLYIIVLVLPNIKMNLPQVYMCSPSWTLLPLPSPHHSSGYFHTLLYFNSQCLWIIEILLYILYPVSIMYSLPMKMWSLLYAPLCPLCIIKLPGT